MVRSLGRHIQRNFTLSSSQASASILSIGTVMLAKNSSSATGTSPEANRTFTPLMIVSGSPCPSHTIVDTGNTLAGMYRIIDAISSEQGVDVSADIVASLDLKFDGEGTMVWDLEGRHVHSFNMTSDMTLLGDVEADVEAEGESHSAELSVELSGDGTWSLTTSK